MDKLRGIGWARGIYQKFDELCHENQGIALKRSAAIDASFESKAAAIQQDHINTVCKLSHVEPVAVDRASNELCLPVELIIPTSVDALDGSESGTISKQVIDVMKTTSCDVSIGETIRENASWSDVPELTSLDEEESFGDSLANKFIDCNDKFSSRIEGPVHDSTDDIGISSMESIELYDEVKLEDSCVIPDSTALYAVSRIMSRRRSYKKRIQDALTSRKRLSKEYEQLAIWFGDADMGPPVHDHSQTLRPSSSTATSEPNNTQTELLCDSDWELL